MGSARDGLFEASTHPETKCCCEQKHPKVSPNKDICTSSSIMQQDKGEFRAPQAQRERQNCKENMSESSATLLEPQSAMESSSLLEAGFASLNTSFVGIQPTPASPSCPSKRWRLPFPPLTMTFLLAPVTNAAPAKPLMSLCTPHPFLAGTTAPLSPCSS